MSIMVSCDSTHHILRDKTKKGKRSVSLKELNTTFLRRVSYCSQMHTEIKCVVSFVQPATVQRIQIQETTQTNKGSQTASSPVAIKTRMRLMLVNES